MNMHNTLTYKYIQRFTRGSFGENKAKIYGEFLNFTNKMECSNYASKKKMMTMMTNGRCRGDCAFV